jgi:hypothetical protein
MPDRVDWAFVRQGECLQFWLKASVSADIRTLAAALEEAWGTYRRIDGDELLSWPATQPAVA